MTTWTVGEGRSSPQMQTAARLAAEDEARDAYLTDYCRRTKWREPGDLCHRGHPLDGRKSNGRRYCKTCKREAMREARKARAG